MKSRRLADGQFARSHQADRDPVAVPVEGAGEQDAAEDEDRQEAATPERPAAQTERAADTDNQRPAPENVANDEPPPAHERPATGRLPLRVPAAANRVPA